MCIFLGIRYVKYINNNLYLNNIVCQTDTHIHRSIICNYTLMNNIPSILIGTYLIEYTLVLMDNNAFNKDNQVSIY